MPHEVDVCGGAYQVINPQFSNTVTRVAPGVFTVEHLLTDDECNALVRKAQQPGVMQPSRTGGGMQPDRRHSFQARCHYEETPRIQARLGRLMGVPVSHLEALKLIHYPAGGFFKLHHDAFGQSFDPVTGVSDWPCVAGGAYPNRIMTCIVYLNDANGGRTVFDNLNVAVQPKKGRAVVFAPAYLPTSRYRPGQRRDCMAHRGEVCAGDKYIATQWAWGCPYDVEKDPKSGLGPTRLSGETV